MTRLLRISMPYATYGIVLDESKVIETAPIAHWMLGKTEADVRAWVTKKGGRIVELLEKL